MRKAILLPAIFLTACSSYPAALPSIKPYSMDIQQGNVVTSKMMLQLRPGMSKAQVRFVMGTPMIADSFHANRWDYLYRLQKGGKLVEQRRVILDFEDEKLAHVRGDVIPAGSNPTASDEKPASKEPVTLKPAAPKEKGLIDKLKFWGEDEKTPAKPQQPVSNEQLEAVQPLLDGPAPKQAAPVQPVKPVAQPAPAAKPEEKGWLDKLQFWKDDEPKAATKPQAKPVQAPAANALPEIGDETAVALPPLMEAPAAEPAAAPAKPVTKPVAAPAAESKPAAPKAEAKPVAKPAPKAEPQKPEAKPVPKPEQDLPPEGDPSYFERLLEKIGF